MFAGPHQVLQHLHIAAEYLIKRKPMAKIFVLQFGSIIYNQQVINDIFYRWIFGAALWFRIGDLVKSLENVFNLSLGQNRKPINLCWLTIKPKTPSPIGLNQFWHRQSKQRTKASAFIVAMRRIWIANPSSSQYKALKFVSPISRIRSDIGLWMAFHWRCANLLLQQFSI